MAINIVDLTNKQENGGKDDHGVLRAEEFNRLVDAVIENQEGLVGVVRGVRFGMGAPAELPDEHGVVTIQSNVTDTYKFSMISPDEQYQTYQEYMNSFPSYILAGEAFNVRVRVSFTEKLEDIDTPISTPLLVNFKVGSNIVASANIYDFNIEDNLIKDSERTISFNYAPYLSKNSVNDISFEIVDKAEYPRINTQTRTFKKVFVVSTEVILKLEGTVNNYNIYNYDSLENEHSNIVINTSTNSGKLSLYETSVPDSPIFEIASITDTTNSIRLNNVNLHNIVREHGTHTIYAVLKYNIPGTNEYIDVKSNEISFIFYNNNVEQTEPLVSINKVSNGVVFKEYGQIIFNYLVYLPETYAGGTDLTINTYPSGKAFTEDNLIISKTYNIIPETLTTYILDGNISYLLSHLDKDTQIESGNYTLVFQFDNFTHTVEIGIEKSNINLENYNVSGQVCYFKSSLKSPGNKEWSYTYEDVNNNITETYNIKFNNFDFTEIGSGFKEDSSLDGGQTVLSIKRGSSIEVPYAIFSKPLQLQSEQGGSTGKTISIEFKTYNCISQVKPIITCIDTNVPEENQVGFIVYPNRMVVKTGTNTFEAKFKEDEQIKLDFVVEGFYTEYHNPTVSGTKGEYTDDKPSSEALMIIYVNGVYQRLHRILSTSDTFYTYIKDGANTINNSNIIIGSEGCDIDLYNIKLYEKPLSPKEVVFNYAYETPKFEDRISIINRNDIWTDAKNDITKLFDISRDKLEKQLPDLPIFSFRMHEENNDKLPEDKKNWKFLTKSAYYNKNITDGNKNTGNISFTVNSAALRNQGTSSMNYPMPWRNWDWKTDTDVATESGAVKDDDPILDTLNKQFFKYGGTTVLGDFWKQYDNMPANAIGKDGGIRKITFKKDYASSEMCNNAVCSSLFTDMAIVAGAKSEFKNVLQPTGTLNKYGYRLSLIATPCFMYQELTGENNGKTKTLGMMNLIPNKNETGYLGLGDVPERSWDIVNILGINDLQLYTGESKVPRAQAWEVAENHVIWDTKYESYAIADVIKSPNKYTNILNLTTGSYKVTINFSKLNDSKKPTEQAAELEAALNLLKLSLGKTNVEDVANVEYDYYIVTDENKNNVFAKVKHKNADDKDKENYTPVMSIESFGTYINSILDNYEARYPKDSSGIKVGSSKINVWEGKEGDFGFAPDSDWIFSDKKFTINDTLTVTQADIINAETRDILRFHNWLVDCHPGKVKENSTITIDGSTVEDNVNNRLAKFKTEAKDYLIIEQWILYYIWRELLWMFDSGSKNLQLYTIDGIHWGCMVRDADTALGIDNLGVEMFPPYLEDTDFYTDYNGIEFYFNKAAEKYAIKQLENSRGKAVLNGQFGSIWLNLRDSYKDEIKSMAHYMFAESVNKFTANKVINEFDSHQDKWSESLYNFGMRQYFGGQLFYKWISSANGNKRLSRKDWLTKAFDYRLGKYKCYPDNQSYNINWRATKLQVPGVQTNQEFELKFYQPCYILSGGSSSGIGKTSPKCYKRITDFGDEITKIPIEGWGFPGEGDSESNTFFYGVHNITDFGPLYKTIELADFNPLNALTKITKLELGSKDWSKTHDVKYGLAKPLLLNGVPKLQHLDITNHHALSTVEINGCTQLEELYMEGTDALSEIILPKTITLKTIKLGKNLRTIDFSGLKGLSSVSFEGYNQLNTFNCENCSEYMKKESFNILKNAVNVVSAKLDVNWGEDNPIDVTDLINFINKGFKIKGKVRVSSLTFEQKLILMASQPDNNGNIDTVSPEIGLRVETASFVPLQTIEVSPQLSYAGILNAEYSLSFSPNNANANNFYKIEWSFESNGTTTGNPSDYIKILNDDAIVRFRRIGEYIEEPAQGQLKPSLNAVVTIHCYSNADKTSTYSINANAEVRIYDRQAKLGDIVYNDGTTSSPLEVDRSKKAIGVCFYIDEDDPTLRLMVSLKEFNDLSASAINAGANNDAVYLTRWGTTSNSNIELLNNPTFDFDTIPNIKQFNAIVPAGVTYWHDLRSADNLSWKKDQGVILGLEPMNGFGELGYKTVTNVSQSFIENIRISDSSFNINNGDKLPYGQFNTLNIIAARNMILTDSTFSAVNNIVKVPAKMLDNNGFDSITEYDALHTYLINTYTYFATDSGHQNMIDMYYPCASFCYGYTPYLQTSGMPVLADKFKEHNWFLPSAGELMRLGYYMNAYVHTNDKNENLNIFKPIFELKASDRLNTELNEINRFTFDEFSDYTRYAMSSESTTKGNTFFLDPINREILNSDKPEDKIIPIDLSILHKNYNSSRSVRPICKF